MKKIIYTVLSFILILNIISLPVLAQVPDPNKVVGNITGLSIPGLDCGVGGATDGSQKCCNLALSQTKTTSNMQLPGLISDLAGMVLDVLSNFPVLGSLVSMLKNVNTDVQTRYKAIQDFQKNNPGVVCIYGDPSPSASAPNCTCKAPASAMLKPVAQLCYKSLASSPDLKDCMNCAAGGGVWSAIGCVPLNLQTFVSSFLLTTGIGLGGIVALLCIIYSALMMQVSQGNPERIKKAQENLTSCILGLMLIIFSVLILRIIGVDILRIPFLQ